MCEPARDYRVPDQRILFCPCFVRVLFSKSPIKLQNGGRENVYFIFFEHPDKLLLIFTEFKETPDYLVERLSAWGFRVGSFPGGMKPGSRDESGTRLFAEQQFREGAIQILMAGS